jgi:hypothetical protein
MWTFLGKFVLPAVPGLVVKGVSYLRKGKGRKEDKRRAAIVEQSEEFKVDPKQEVDQIEIIPVEDLPRHKTRRWGRRGLNAIKRIVIHHTATDYKHSSWRGIANYVTTPSPDNHLSKEGAPYIPYHFGVGIDGVFQFNDVQCITWGARGYNIESIHVSVLGDFTTAGSHIGKNNLQPVHRSQLIQLLKALKQDFPEAEITTHKVLGKWNCPGDELVALVAQFNEGVFND